MGLLQTAAIVSGAGKAGTQALNTAQAGAIQLSLQEAREQWDSKRLEQTEKYAMAREERQGELQKGLLATKIAADEANTAKTLAAHSADVKTQTEAQKEIHAGDRKSAEGIHAADRTSKETLAREEIAMNSKYYDALSKYYTDRGNAAVGKAGSGEGPTDKKQKEYLESVTKPLIDNLSKQLEMADPDEKPEIQERLDHVIDEARRVANIEIPAAGGEIKDRFKPAVTGGR